MFKYLTVISIFTVFVFITTVDAQKAKSVDMYYLKPNTEKTLSWSVDCGGQGKYEINNYHGKSVTSGHYTVTNNILTVKLKLPSGYYDIIFKRLKLHAGIIVQDDYSGDVDKFYGADAAWSWLEKDKSNRESWMKLLKRYGIGVARERFSWGEMSSTSGYDEIRKEYQRHGLKILDVHHDSPKELNGGMMRLPKGMDKVFKCWKKITKRYETVWAAMETWNEENDEIFSGNTPPDQYAVYHKVLANAVSRTNVGIKVLNGGFSASISKEYLDAMRKNGLLHFVDAVAFHYYNSPKELSGCINRYRAWMYESGHSDLPIWLTEAGNGYNKTKGKRAPLDTAVKRSARFSALATEARAAGVSKFFPFIFAWYNIEKINYSLVDKARTPTRSLAGYLFQIKQLAGTKYIGSIKLKPPVITTRVFRRSDEAIIVIYTGKPATIDFAGIKVIKAFGADGRRLSLPVNGRLDIPDGFIYLVTQWKKLSPVIIRAPAPVKLQAKRTQPFSPIVLQFVPLPKTPASLHYGYRMKSGLKKLTFKVWNFSDKPVKTTIKMPDAIPVEQTISISAESSTDIAMMLKIPELSANHPTGFSVQALDVNGQEIDRICLNFTAPGIIENLLKKYPAHTQINIKEKLIKNPVATKGINQLSFTNNSITADIDLRTASGAWNNWAGVYIKLKGISFKNKTGMIYSGKCSGSGWTDITFELRNNDRFRISGFPVDSFRHDIYIPFNKINAKYFDSYNKKQKKQLFDPAEITAVEFVIHSNNRNNKMTISNLYLVEAQKGK